MPCFGIRIRFLILEQGLEVTLATMVKPSIVPAVVNGSILAEEIFSENVAFLRENIDHMFVLLMGAITCFLQVVSFYILNNLSKNHGGGGAAALTLVLLLLFHFSEPILFKAGFGMLEAGSVRSKNTTNILTKNFGDLCLGVVAFCLLGYGLAFSEGNAWVGDQYFGLINLPYSLYPHVFMQVSRLNVTKWFEGQCTMAQARN